MIKRLIEEVANGCAERRRPALPLGLRLKAHDLQRSRPARSGRHLRYAVVAADYGSFRQAAEALSLQQSTLSRCIRQLEHAIGMTIFDRSNGGVQATPAGRDFLRMARSILDQMDTLAVSAYSTGRGEAGRLVIGFYTSLSAGNLRASLIEYAQRFPQITIGMIESSRIRLVTALQNGAIDLAIVTGGTPFHGNKSMSLWSERVVITLPEGHRLAAGETIYWTDLKGEALLLSQRDPDRKFKTSWSLVVREECLSP